MYTISGNHTKYKSVENEDKNFALDIKNNKGDIVGHCSKIFVERTKTTEMFIRFPEKCSDTEKELIMAGALLLSVQFLD